MARLRDVLPLTICTGRAYYVRRDRLPAECVCSLAAAVICLHFNLIGTVASITIFVALMIEFFIRYANDRPVRQPKAVAAFGKMIFCRGVMDTRMQLMVLGVSLNTLFLFIRCVNDTVSAFPVLTGRLALGRSIAR